MPLQRTNRAAAPGEAGTGLEVFTWFVGVLRAWGITYESYGTKNAGVNYGLVFTAWGAGGVIGPIVPGKVADLTGAYHSAYLIASVLCIAGCVLTRLIRNPKMARAVVPVPIA